jgi:hypothetical protein
MVEARGHSDFSEEALRAARGGELGIEHLERDLAIPLVPDQVDRRHPATAKLAVDAVGAEMITRPKSLAGGQAREHRGGMSGPCILEEAGRLIVGLQQALDRGP